MQPIKRVAGIVLCMGCVFSSLADFSVLPDDRKATEPDQIVNEIIERFDKIAEPSADLTEKLNLINATSAAFLKLAVPFRALLASSLKIADKPQSPQFKALKKLSENVNHQFSRARERPNYGSIISNVAVKEENFYAEAVISLDVLMDLVKIFLDPTYKKGPSNVAELLQHCDGGYGVRMLSKKMASTFTASCSINSTAVYSAILSLWRRLKTYYGITAVYNSETIYKQRLISEILYTTPINNVQIVINRLVYNLPVLATFRRAVDWLYESVKAKHWSTEPRCLTDIVFDSAEYNRVRISLYLSDIQLQLSRLMIATNVCGRFMFSTDMDIDMFNNMLLSVGDDVAKIAKVLVDYIPKKLNNCAVIEEIIVRKAIEEFPGGSGYIVPDSYKFISTDIVNRLQHAGPENIRRRILVVPSKNYDERYSAFYACKPYFCSTVMEQFHMEQRGITVVIARYEFRRDFLGLSLKNYTDNIQPKIEGLLREIYYKDLSTIVGELSERNVTITGDLATTSVILRHKTHAWTSCEYPAYPAPYFRDVDDRPDARTFQWNNFLAKAWTDDNTCYQFFFFL